MKNIFQIPRYEKVNDQFVINGYDEYIITYKMAKGARLKIFVNDFESSHYISISKVRSPYKSKLLTAISEYIKRDKSILIEAPIDGYDTIENAKERYPGNYIHNIKEHLLTINKEVNRDNLTKYGIIDAENAKLGKIQEILWDWKQSEEYDEPVYNDIKKQGLTFIHRLTERQLKAVSDSFSNPNRTLSIEWETNKGKMHLEIGRKNFSFFVKDIKGNCPVLHNGTDLLTNVELVKKHINDLI